MELFPSRPNPPWKIKQLRITRVQKQTNPTCFPLGSVLQFSHDSTTYLSGTKAQVTYAPEGTSFHGYISLCFLTSLLQTDSDDVIEITYDNPFLGELQIKSSQPQRFKIDLSYKRQEHLKLAVKITPILPTGRQSTDELTRGSTLPNASDPKKKLLQASDDSIGEARGTASMIRLDLGMQSHLPLLSFSDFFPFALLVISPQRSQNSTLPKFPPIFI